MSEAKHLNEKQIAEAKELWESIEAYAYDWWMDENCGHHPKYAERKEASGNRAKLVIQNLILQRDARATPALTTADKIAMAMLDDLKIRATTIPWANGKECPMLVLRIEEKNMNIHPASWGSEDERWMLTVCGSRGKLPGDYMGIVSSSVAALCREKWESLKAKQEGGR